MKKILLVITLAACSMALKAQYDAQFSQYWACKNYYNAGCTGMDKSANVTFVDKQQWVGITNAPKSMFVSLDMPVNFLGKSQGVGLSLYSDNIGLFANSSLMLNYAYKIKKWGGVLSFGTQIGFINESFDGSKLKWDNLSSAQTKDDPAIPSTAVQAMAFDMGLGAYYSNEKFYAGLSATHLMEPTLDFDEKSSTYVGRLMYFMSGYKVPLEEYQIVLYPSTMVKTDFRVYQVELTLKADYKDAFWGGLSYRWDNAVVAMLGTRIKNISLGYAYDISTSKLMSASMGSHEIFINYAFDFVLQSNNKRKTNKSLRYL